jgi:transcriptional regulator with XRE-family HTH domain
MRLCDYLYEHKITATEFAKKVGMSRHHISRIKNNHHRPGGALALRICRETKGKVTLDDLLRD